MGQGVIVNLERQAFPGAGADNIQTLLAEATSRNIKLWIEGETLQFSCPPASMSDEFCAVLRSKRDEIVKVLRARQSSAAFGSRAPVFTADPRPAILPIIAYHRARWRSMAPGNGNLKFVNGAHSVFVVHGELDIPTLQKSVDFLVARHAILRAHVRDFDTGPAFVLDGNCSVKVEFSDVADAPDRMSLARDLASKAVWRPIETGSEPWFRVFAIRLEYGKYVVGFVIHHFIGDVVSINVARFELLTAYRSFRKGQLPPLQPLALQYTDYVAGMNDWLQNGNAEAHAAYWRQHLANAPPTTLPADADLEPNHAGAECTFSFDIPQDTVTALCERYSGRIAKLSVVSAAFAASLAVLGKSEDVVIRTVMTGRLDARLLNVIGAFFDIVALRIAVQPSDGLLDLVAQARKTILEGAAHQVFSYNLVKAMLPQIGASDVSPILNFYSTEGGQPDRWGNAHRVERFDIHPPPQPPQLAKWFPSLNMRVVHDPGGLHVCIDYLGARHEERTIRRFADMFGSAFEKILKSPHSRVSNLVQYPLPEQHG